MSFFCPHTWLIVWLGRGFQDGHHFPSKFWRHCSMAFQVAVLLVRRLSLSSPSCRFFFPFSSLINFSDRLLCGPMFMQWTGLSIGELLHCCHGNFLESSSQWPLHLHFLHYLFLELSSARFLEQPSNIFILPFISYFLSLGLFALFSGWFPQVYLLAAWGGEESEDLVAFKTDSANSQAPGGIQLSLLA